MRLGHTASALEWDAAKLPVTAGAMKARFGSWGDFCRKAGLQPKRHSSLDPETCVAAIQALASKLGRAPSKRDWQEHHDWLRERGYPSSPTSLRNQLHGSFTEVVARALEDAS